MIFIVYYNFLINNYLAFKNSTDLPLSSQCRCLFNLSSSNWRDFSTSIERLSFAKSSLRNLSTWTKISNFENNSKTLRTITITENYERFTKSRLLIYLRFRSCWTNKTRAELLSFRGAAIVDRSGKVINKQLITSSLILYPGNSNNHGSSESDLNLSEKLSMLHTSRQFSCMGRWSEQL